MKIIYANSLWLGLLIIGITNAGLSRFNSEEWENMSDIRLNYTIFYGAIMLLLVFSIIGLLLKRKWGYELAQASNFSMALMPISIFVLSLVMLPTQSVAQQLSIHSLNLVVGVISLYFGLSLALSGVKAKYVRQNL